MTDKLNVVYFDWDPSWHSIMQDATASMKFVNLILAPGFLQYKKFLKGNVDLVVTEYNLDPRSFRYRDHGMELAKIINRRFPETPVIVFSAYNNVEKIVKAAKISSIKGILHKQGTTEKILQEMILKNTRTAIA